MVLWRPTHAQLRHPLLDVDIADAAKAQTAWGVHFASFRDLLRRVAVAQRLRFPEAIVAFPPERKAFRIQEAPYGFQLLCLRHADLSVCIPELSLYPAQTYPVRPISGGHSDQIVVLDGWSGVVSGLLVFTPHVAIQLEGSLEGIEDAAWQILRDLDVVLDATILIQELRGELRARYDQTGWTEIPGIRKSAGSYRIPPEKPQIRNPSQDPGSFLDGGNP